MSDQDQNQSVTDTDAGDNTDNTDNTHTSSTDTDPSVVQSGDDDTGNDDSSTNDDTSTNQPSVPSSTPSSSTVSPAGFVKPAALGLPYGSQGSIQDPFLPQWPSQGPIFLDTGACICALREPPPDNDQNKMQWRCQGNATDNIYIGNGGKWYAPDHDISDTKSLPVEDGSDPPKTDATFISQGKGGLVDLGTVNPDPLSLQDQACTGLNQTSFSTSYYRAGVELAANQTPVAAAPCYLAGAIPIKLQNETSWLDEGCHQGFFCESSYMILPERKANLADSSVGPSNTINTLPQYCTPVEPCVKARLGGASCAVPGLFDGRIQGMGPFEPTMCTPGFYCPHDSYPPQEIVCPKGSYCPPGSQKPIKCSAGSHCPEKAQNETILVPFGILILVDVLAILLLLFLRFYGSAALSRRSHQSYLPKRIHMTDKSAGYKNLEDDDVEMAPLEARITPIQRAPTGFQAAIDEQYLYDSGVEGAIDLDSSAELRAFVDSMKRAVQTSNFGLSFGFSELSFHPRGTTKPILSHISGSIPSGSLVGVMGGSGAGKSTFVNVLMGRSSHTGGSVRVNGVAGKIKQYKKIIGYVPQDDIVLPELTVRENILHSARVRLPSNWSDKDIQKHADAVVDCLELSHVRDSRVGSVAKPIISGGQRKRVSIGIELAAAPMALFLDEPTSGLDATAASSIMKMLKALSHLGISIIVIIHQPRIEIFEMIDSLILLGNGRLIYQGKESEVQDYFENLGFDFPKYANAGDVVTDIITGNGRPYKRVGDVSKDALINNWEAITAQHQPKLEVQASTTEMASLRVTIKHRGAPWPRQIYHCLNRALLQQYRTKASFWFEMGVSAFGGFLIGLAQNGQKGVNFHGFFLNDYELLSSAIDYQSVPQMSLLVCISIGLISSSPGVRVFGEEYLIHRREAESGHNVFAYYIAKIVSTLPRMIFSCFHFTTMFILLATPVIPYLASFICNLLYFYCIYGLASVVSMLSRQEDGPLLAVMASLIVGVLSGSAPPLKKADSWHVGWLWRSSPGVWLAEIYFGRNVEPWGFLYDTHHAARATGFALDAFAKDLLSLLLIGTVYRVLAYGVLVLGGRVKRR
ncbi:MAG: hypothetical protein OHK93_005270 [Ramalina farinacea]|uniref:ABC transporter domain-containing protein n=1 Tax=Ramalina farinacea TaxID=258253 RepID=A0AA43QVT4_9LECA|nr:hypothetical protein [Ramalina farinacea]